MLATTIRSAVSTVSLAALLAIATAAPALAAKWQSVGTIDISAGQVNLQEGYQCPAKTPVALSGAYAFNSTGQASQVYVTFNGPRIDEATPDFSSWGWHFYWPAGAPSGTTLQLDIYCTTSKK